MSLRTVHRSPGDHEVSAAANRFRQRALSNRRRPWRRALVIVLAAGLAVLLGWVVGWSTLLGVDVVEVDGVSGSEATAVRELVDVAPGTPLARVDTDAVASRVRARVTVAEVSVRRSWPRTVTVEVVPRTAALVVRNPRGQLEVVDATGVAFGVVRSVPAGVPVVTATGSEGTSREALLASLALLEALPDGLAKDVSAVRGEQCEPRDLHARLAHRRLGRRRAVGPQGRHPHGAAAHQGEGHRRQCPGHAGHAVGRTVPTAVGCGQWGRWGA